MPAGICADVIWSCGVLTLKVTERTESGKKAGVYW